MNDPIDILMATYNGAEYLSEQIESILNQTHANLRLLIRDDGSTDNTFQLLTEFQRKDPQRIFLAPSNQNLGIKGNFSSLMQSSTAPYVLFSDQDDIWLSQKVERSLAKMKQLESREGKDKPLLVHSDLIVVNENLELISPSFWHYTKRIPPLASGLNRLIVQNVVTGCSMLINQALLKKAYPIPKESLMHDWWIALVAAAFGSMVCIEEPLTLYRQHPSNSLGAAYFWNFKNIVNAFSKMKRGDPQKSLQASTFLSRYQSELTQNQKRMLQTYLKLQQCPFWKSRYFIYKYGFLKNGFLRNFATFFMQGQP